MTGSDVPALSIVVPCYRSEACLDALVEAIDRALSESGRRYEVILVNDCSPDGTWETIARLCNTRAHLIGVNLRKNFGQDNAIMTGLRFASGRYVAIMDDDLQHDPSELPRLLERIEETGADVVYAKFETKKQKLWKNLGSWFNGKVADWLLQKPSHIYISPYKIVRREVCEMILRYAGPFPYVDGLLFQVTSRFDQIPAEHHHRHAGTSNYTLVRSINLWSRLMFSFSVRPLRLVMWLGFATAAGALAAAAIVIWYRVVYPENFSAATAGWTSLMTALFFLAGIQLIFLGVLGEYVGRSHLTLNCTPQTSIAEVRGWVPAAACASRINTRE
jgi:glycosyltransferase involved in cell wall biosynthesis